MGTFINLELGNPTPLVYKKKHLIFISIWLLNFGVFVLRLDSNLANAFIRNIELMNLLIPTLTVMIDVYYCMKQKWYYNIALIFYPLLVIFWFFPKLILEKGKIYLFLYYLNSIAVYFNSFKRSLIQSGIFLLICLFLLTTNNKEVRIIAVIYFTYIFFKVLYIYVAGSYKIVHKSKNGKTKNTSSLSNLNLVDTIENQKDDEKLTPEQNSQKKIKSIVLWNFFLQYISNNVNSIRGKRAYTIVWFFQYFLYVSLTISFFTFLNYQLFNISSGNFYFKYTPDLFDFFYYTIKSAMNGSVDYLKPVSELARISDVCCFTIVTIYFFIITISSIYSLKMSEYNQDMQVAVNACQVQNDKIVEHLKTKYNTDIPKAVNEIETINNSIIKLKDILERVL